MHRLPYRSTAQTGRHSLHRPPRHQGGLHRQGLSLLEILLSTAILVASLTAVMQVLNVGYSSRLSAVLDSEAILRCQSIMGEMVSGVRPLMSAGETAFDDNSRWMWSATVSDQGNTSLLEVEVTVKHTIGGDRSNSSWSLKRYVRDPQIFLDAAGDTE